jgi:hypothetical protein
MEGADMLDVDDLYPEHPKLLALGTWCDVAGWLNLAAMAWCKRYLTDGRIPRMAVWRLAAFRGMTIDGEPVTPEAVAARLVEVGLWEERGGLYVIHDFLVYQESRETVLERRRADRERKRNPATSQEARDPPGFQPDSSRNPDGFRSDSDGPLPLPLPDPSPSVQASSLDLGSGARARARERVIPHRAEPRTREALPALVR